MIQTWHVNEYGLKIYVDGKLVATFTKEQFPQLIADLSQGLVSHPFPMVKSRDIQTPIT